MPLPPADRFTVAAVLRQVIEAVSAAGPPVVVDGHPVDSGSADLAELLGWFRSQCAAIVAHAPTDAVPLRLPKARIGELLACERGALARLAGSGLAEPLVRGKLTDLLVGQHLTLGLGATPADVEDDLRSALAARGDDDVLIWLQEVDDEARARIWGHAVAVADGLRASWGEVPRDWWPRTQERVVVEVADGALVLAAQFDVALGGPPTAHPLVVLEVKAGRSADRHRRDLLWYGLLAALRHGELPAVVATWTAADDRLVPVPVTLGAVEAAARRGLDALELLVELAAGRRPRATPHVGCHWCPDRLQCEPGQQWLAANGPLPASDADLLAAEAQAVGAAADPVADEPEWDPGDDEDEPWS